MTLSMCWTCTVYSDVCSFCSCWEKCQLCTGEWEVKMRGILTMSVPTLMKPGGGEKKKCQKRNKKKQATRKTMPCVLTRTAPIFSFGVLCCPSEELKEIACDCSLECLAERSDCRQKKSQRHQSDANYWAFSHTAPKLQFNSGRLILIRCL